MKFVVFFTRDDRGRKQWFFRLVRLANGKTVAQSEGYRRRIDCYSTVDQIRERAGGAQIEELEDEQCS